MVLQYETTNGFQRSAFPIRGDGFTVKTNDFA